MDDCYFIELMFDDEMVKMFIYIMQECCDLLFCDLGLVMQEFNQVNENKLIGLNIEYFVNDDLILEFDFYNLLVEGCLDVFYGIWINLGLGVNVVCGQGVDFSGDFFIMLVDYDDVVCGNLNFNGVFDQDDVGMFILDMNYLL